MVPLLKIGGSSYLAPTEMFPLRNYQPGSEPEPIDTDYLPKATL